MVAPALAGMQWRFFEIDMAVRERVFPDWVASEKTKGPSPGGRALLIRKLFERKIAHLARKHHRAIWNAYLPMPAASRAKLSTKPGRTPRMKVPMAGRTSAVRRPGVSGSRASVASLGSCMYMTTSKRR